MHLHPDTLGHTDGLWPQLTLPVCPQIHCLLPLHLKPNVTQAEVRDLVSRSDSNTGPQATAALVSRGVAGVLMSPAGHLSSYLQTSPHTRLFLRRVREERLRLRDLQ